MWSQGDLIVHGCVWKRSKPHGMFMQFGHKIIQFSNIMFWLEDSFLFFDKYLKILHQLLPLEVTCSSCMIPIQKEMKTSLCHLGLAPRFGLPKPITILIAHLLLNIKKHHKSPKNLFMQNKCYIMFLAWITLKKTIKTKCNLGYSNYLSNSFLTKNFLSVNREKKKSRSYKSQQN